MKGPTVFFGLSRHAKALGVSFGHLRRVLVGERHSPTLLARYEALVKAEKEMPRRLLDTSFDRLEKLGARLVVASSESRRKAIHRQARQLFTPDFHRAFASLESTERFTALHLRGVAAVAPFVADLAASLGVQLPPSPSGESGTIKLGGARATP